MEKAAAALRLSEGLLMVGESGTGKTSIVQQLAKRVCGRCTLRG
jgi:midasin (ATPase involved in ribosome maturation)